MNKEHITNVREISSCFLRLKEKTVLSDISQFSLFKWLNISAVLVKHSTSVGPNFLLDCLYKF